MTQSKRAAETPISDAAGKHAIVELNLGRGSFQEAAEAIGIVLEQSRSLELALARRDALLRRWIERRKHLGGLLQDDLLEDSERELSK